MFLSLLKKEIKQFCRSKSDLLLLFLFPILLITTLSVGLGNMMTTSGDAFDTDGEVVKIYYTIEGSSKYKEGFNSFMTGVKETIDVEFEEEPSLGEVIEKVDNYEGLMHINVGDEGFNIYTSKKGEKLNAKIFRGIFEGVLNEYAIYNTIGEYNPKAFASLVKNKYDDYVVKETGSVTRNVSSAEYYTFAELALIILFVSQTVGESVYKENQLRTINRIRLSKVKESTMIASKVMLGVGISVVQTLLIYVYSSTVLGVDWGENTLKFMLLFIIFGIFASVLGVVVGLMSKKDTTIGGILSMIIFVVCALGGCYTPMSMIVTVPILNQIMFISPIYWINTATSSMICGLQTDAYLIALIIPIILSMICVMIYFTILKKKGGIANA